MLNRQREGKVSDLAWRLESWWAGKGIVRAMFELWNRPKSTVLNHNLIFHKAQSTMLITFTTQVSCGSSKFIE